jgi:predicted outer membrane repeat protein
MRSLSTSSTLSGLLLGCLLAPLGWPAPADAATRYVNPMALIGTDVNNWCLVQATPCLTIRHAVAMAFSNDEIVLMSWSFLAFGDIDIDVNKSLTFRGFCMGNCPTGRVKLSGLTTGRHFYISDVNATVRMSNLELYDGSAPRGGSILNRGRLTLLNCNIHDNAATSGDGGGIYNEGGRVVISGTEVRANTATRNGGGVFNDEGGELTVTRSSVLDSNGALTSGGGIYTTTSSAYVKIEDKSSLRSNAAGFGGGVFVEEDASLNISSSILDGNLAGVDGGAVFNAGGDVSATLASFIDNEAGDGSGGATRNTGNGTLSITQSEFLRNLAAIGGGAISDIGTGQFSITHSQFIENSATRGGALHAFSVAGPATVVTAIDAVTFVGNSAGEIGGAIYYEPADGLLTIVNSTFSSNDADIGGAIYNSSLDPNRIGRVEIASATFFGNAALDGPAIYNGRPLVLNNSIVTNSDDLTAGDVDNACSNFDSITGSGNRIGIEAVALDDRSCNSSALFNAGYVTRFNATLQGNGGLALGANNAPTLTHALIAGSNAIDSIPSFSCLAPDGLPLSLDQRTAVRPREAGLPSGDASARCDIGAVEQR